ncbi:MAG TPA: phosphate ABC transporter substrate-binding protein PstS [Terriglobales bacterium]|nr:phosphate ABC transporter substrate-binding protein PstS [Terriglobales bacterium]
MLRVLKLVVCATTLAASALPAKDLNGAGATFPNPIYQKWFSEFRKAHPDVEINYQSVGSGAGIRQLTEGTVDFGASDGPMTDQQITEFKNKRHTDVLHVPTVLGAVVPAYNLPGISADLKFSGELLADIFLGKIKKWNDAAIANVNPNVKLPNTDIIIVHRSDGSGTTYIFTDYLCKISSEWQQKVGKNTSVNWPTGLGQKGNEGVAGEIRQMQGAIGYIELIYALQNKIAFGSVQNSTGKFIKGSLESVTAAAASAKNMPIDFRVSITNAPGKNAYPISSFTWLLIPAKWSDGAKRRVVVDFLSWMLNTGEGMTSDLNYAPLPKTVADKVRAEIKAIH